MFPSSLTAAAWSLYSAAANWPVVSDLHLYDSQCLSRAGWLERLCLLMYVSFLTYCCHMIIVFCCSQQTCWLRSPRPLWQPVPSVGGPFTQHAVWLEGRFYFHTYHCRMIFIIGILLQPTDLLSQISTSFMTASAFGGGPFTRWVLYSSVGDFLISMSLWQRHTNKPE